MVAGLTKRLTSDLPAAVTAVNADVTDGILIDPARQILDHVPPPSLLTAFPTVCVAEGPGRFEDDLAHEATGVNELHVLAFLQHSDHQALVRLLRRYRLALARVVLANRVIPHPTQAGVNAAWGLRLVRFEPGPTLGEKDGETVKTWLSWIDVTLEARGDEI